MHRNRTATAIISVAAELEFGEMNQEEQEFEMARRFVRLAGAAARL